MTPKEKAKELVSRYRKEILKDEYNISGWVIEELTLECALIAVDETIRTLNEDIRDLDVRGNILLDLIDYWREVKQEIEKL
jgi:hypothetical protein